MTQPFEPELGNGIHSALVNPTTLSGATYDCAANDPSGSLRPARMIVVFSGVLKYTDAGGNTVTLPTVSSPFYLLGLNVAALVKSGSTATQVLVIW
jgi:hypothetical protein